MIPVVKSPCTQFIVLKFDGSICIIGKEAHHQSAGVWPRLAVKVSDVPDAETGFFTHFALYALF